MVYLFLIWPENFILKWWKNQQNLPRSHLLLTWSFIKNLCRSSLSGSLPSRFKLADEPSSHFTKDFSRFVIRLQHPFLLEQLQYTKYFQIDNQKIHCCTFDLVLYTGPVFNFINRFWRRWVNMLNDCNGDVIIEIPPKISYTNRLFGRWMLICMLFRVGSAQKSFKICLF